MPETSQNRTMRSLLPTASVLPSGVKATTLTRLGTVSGALIIGWPGSLRSQRCAAPAESAAASTRPSSRKATACTASAAPVSAPRGAGVGPTVHNRTVRSALPATRIVPSGLNSMPSTRPRASVSGWPSGAAWAGSATVHSRTVWSVPPVASDLPSGLNATAYTDLVCPVSGGPTRRGLRGTQVPQENGGVRAVLVGRPTRRQQPAVGAHRDHLPRPTRTDRPGHHGRAGRGDRRPLRAVRAERENLLELVDDQHLRAVQLGEPACRVRARVISRQRFPCCRNAKPSPARSTEDLPEPDGPTTISSPGRPASRSNSSVSASRPKNQSPCSVWKHSNPRYGAGVVIGRRPSGRRTRSRASTHRWRSSGSRTPQTSTILVNRGSWDAPAEVPADRAVGRAGRLGHLPDGQPGPLPQLIQLPSEPLPARPRLKLCLVTPPKLPVQFCGPSGHGPPPTHGTQPGDPPDPWSSTP